MYLLLSIHVVTKLDTTMHVFLRAYNMYIYIYMLPPPNVYPLLVSIVFAVFYAFFVVLWGKQQNNGPVLKSI